MPDGTSDAVESASLEGPAAAWLAERAQELDVSTEKLLERVVAAYRVAEAEADDVTADVVTEQELDDRLAAVEADIVELDDDVAGKIQDVRDRVIQVKREADAKAPTDHDHPELTDDVAAARDAVADVEAEVVDVAETVAALSDRADAGFDNFEDVLGYLRDETDDLDRKLTTLAAAVLGMRESVASLAAADARRRQTDRLKRAANEKHVREAECEACESKLTVSLLTTPECPACGATFEGVEANPGWFGTHRLLAGSAPALEAGAVDADAGDEEWLGTDAETLESMASGDQDDDAGPEVVDSAAVTETPSDEHEDPSSAVADTDESTSASAGNHQSADGSATADEDVDDDALDGEPLDVDENAFDIEEGIDDDVLDLGEENVTDADDGESNA